MCLKSCRKDPETRSQCLTYDRCSLNVHRGGGEREAIYSQLGPSMEGVLGSDRRSVGDFLIWGKMPPPGRCPQ